jgi:hypothetical protein
LRLLKPSESFDVFKGSASDAFAIVSLHVNCRLLNKQNQKVVIIADVTTKAADQGRAIKIRAMASSMTDVGGAQDHKDKGKPNKRLVDSFPLIHPVPLECLSNRYAENKQHINPKGAKRHFGC